jgi:hypothetical protein
MFAAIIGILCYRFGPSGIIIIGIVLAFLPLQIIVGIINGKILQKINVNKDQRMKACA